MSELTHDDLCEIAIKFLQSNGFKVAFGDKFQSRNGTGEQPDAIGFRCGVSCLLEAKVSRSDFLADKKKHFRVDPDRGMGDWRFFISPPDVIKPEDLPDGWGLLHVKGKRVFKVHGWPPNTIGMTENHLMQTNRPSVITCIAPFAGYKFVVTYMKYMKEYRRELFNELPIMQ